MAGKEGSELPCIYQLPSVGEGLKVSHQVQFQEHLSQEVSFLSLLMRKQRQEVRQLDPAHAADRML